MIHKSPPLRSASAAIAAVLALSSTTGFAQVEAAPVVAPAQPPAPTIVIPQSTPPVVSAPTIVLPVQPEAPEAEAAIAEAPTPVRQPRVAQTTPSATPVAVAPRGPARAPASVSPESQRAVVDGSVTSSTVAPADDVEFAPVQAPLAEDSAVAVAPVDDGLTAGELGLIGGALAIGGLAAAAMLARRRRRDPDGEPEDYVAATFAPTQSDGSHIVAMPTAAARSASSVGTGQLARSAPVTEPATIAPIAPAQRARLPSAATTGPHVRMAERGPTADNPFLTRKNRMRRARFLDAQGAKAGVSELSGDWLNDENIRFRAATSR